MSSWGSFLTFKSPNLLCVAPGAATQLPPLHVCSGEVGSLSKLPSLEDSLVSHLRPKQKEDASCSGWGWQQKSLRAIPFHAKPELISLLEVQGHRSPGRHLNKSSESLALQTLLDQDDIRLCYALTRYQQSEGKLSSLLNPIITQETLRSRLMGLTAKQIISVGLWQSGVGCAIGSELTSD